MIRFLLSRVESIGTSEKLSFDELRRIKISNKLLLIGIFSTLIFSASDITTHLYIPAVLLSCCTLLFIFGFYLTSKGKNNLSSFIAVVSISCSIFLNAIMIKGDVGIAYILLAFIGLPVVNIDWQKKWLLFTSMLFPTLFFIAAIALDVTSFGIYNISEKLQNSLLLGAVFQSVVLVIGQIFFFLKEMDYRYQLHKEQHQKIIQQGTMSDLGVMSAGIAHEINNPLTVIKLFSVTLRKQISTLENKKVVAESLTNIEKIDENINRIVKIINGIKHLARNSEHDKFVPVSVTKILNQLHDLFTSRLNTLGISFVVTPPVSEIFALCRGAQIEQVLVSLLSNAIDALKNTENPQIILCGDEKDGRVLISVEDNGEGISVENESLVMKSFYSTKPIGKGTGIGLSIAKSIIEDHNGELILASLKPVKFQILLPLATLEDEV